MDDEIDLLGVYRAIREDWLWIVSITGFFAVATIIAALLATEMFRAKVVISQVADGRDGGRAALLQSLSGLAGLAGIDIGTSSGGSAQLARSYLASRTLVERFITKHDLIPVLYPDPNPDQPPTLWIATRDFMEEVLTVTHDAATGLISVTIEWTDPQTAADWANGIVAIANEDLRVRALAEAERNIEYLKGQIEKTSVVGMQQAMFNLVEAEMTTVMLANAREEYAFAVVDRAVPPEERASPRRTLMVIVGTTLGGFVSLIVVGIRRLWLAIRRREAELAQRPIP